MEPPLRSWSIMLKPPCALMPGMAGGAMRRCRASGILANSTLRLVMMPAAVSSGDLRSSHGSKLREERADVARAVRVRKLQPAMPFVVLDALRCFSIVWLILS